MTQLSISHLRKLALGATKGPWNVSVSNGGRSVRVIGYKEWIGIASIHAGLLREANAAYIAALPPETILALLKAVEALKPFADFYNAHAERIAKNPAIWPDTESLFNFGPHGLAFGDVRKASEALSVIGE